MYCFCRYCAIGTSRSLVSRDILTLFSALHFIDIQASAAACHSKACGCFLLLLFFLLSWSYSLPEFCALSAKVSFRIQLNNKRSHFPEPFIYFQSEQDSFFCVVARSGNSLQNSACCFKSNAHVLPTGTQGMLRCLLCNPQSISHLIEWFAVSTGQQDCQVPGTG